MGEVFPELKEVRIMLFCISEELELLKWLYGRD